MNIDKKLTEILTSTLVIENKKGIPFAVAKIKELIVMNQSKEETAKDLPVRGTNIQISNNLNRSRNEQ